MWTLEKHGNALFDGLPEHVAKSRTFHKLKKFHDLYDFMAKSPAVMDMFLNIAAKFTAQIAAKILHLRGVDL